MDKNLYLKLATTNIKKNKEIHLPYVIAIVMITIMYYLVVAMLKNEGLKDVPSSATLNQCFAISHNLIRIIAFIFMIYINSFLIKKRLKEFGLYNILGLEKKHIIYVMLLENIIVFGGAVFSGMILGTALGKFCFLLLLKICHTTTSSSFIISVTPYIVTLKLFGVIFLCCLVINVITILRNKTIDLLHRDKYGEKKMRGLLLFTIIGFILLIAAYYKANTIINYVQAIQIFFEAVLMVIIATYLLFISGSITLLGGLKKNKKFYYKTKNFISTSSLIYRMKQNAVGLANICILSTMVIVTAAGCASLYMGQETIVKGRNPFDLTVKAQSDILSKEVLNQLAEQHNITIQDYVEFTAVDGTFRIDGNSVKRLGPDSMSLIDVDEDSLYEFIAISQEEYNRINHSDIDLEKNHIVLSSLDDMTMFENGLNAEGNLYKVDEVLNENILLTCKNGDVMKTIYVIFANEEEAIEFTNLVYQSSYDTNEIESIQYANYEGEENDRALFGLEVYNRAETKSLVNNIDSERLEAYAIYGGIFFIGIFFILIFLTITILIIYFKQVTEGYDDRERFVILQKVGMDGSMVKQAINRQIIIVFFMPLFMALMHLVAASNIIKSMMTAFYLVDVTLIYQCIGITSAIFAAIYVIVYKMTAKVYYKIVKF